MNKKMLTRLLLVLFLSLGAVRTGIAHAESESGWLEEGKRKNGRIGSEMQHLEYGERSHANRAVWGGRAFQHAGRDYYWDEHPEQCDNQTICSVSIKELRKAKNYKRERRDALPKETNTDQSTILSTVIENSEEDALELKYSNGSQPQRITWSCGSDEVCCKRGCCYEDTFYYRKSFWRKYGMIWGIVGTSIGILCACFWCCWGMYWCMRGARSFREPAPYGAPVPVYGPVYPAYAGHGHSLRSAQTMGYSVQPTESQKQQSQHALPKQKREVGSKESREKVSTINEEQEDY